MVRSLLRRFFPKFMWKIEREEEFTEPNVVFKVPPQDGDTIIFTWYVDENEPPVVDSVLVNGRVLLKDEYDVR